MLLKFLNITRFIKVGLFILMSWYSFAPKVELKFPYAVPYGSVDGNFKYKKFNNLTAIAV